MFSKKEPRVYNEAKAPESVVNQAASGVASGLTGTVYAKDDNGDRYQIDFHKGSDKGLLGLITEETPDNAEITYLGRDK